MQKLWLDDERNPLPGYDLWAKTASHAIDYLQTHEIGEISLDHDLGDEKLVGNGYDVIKWMEEQAFNEALNPMVIYIHTANPIARVRMMQAADNCYRFWKRSNKDLDIPGPTIRNYTKEM